MDGSRAQAVLLGGAFNGVLSALPIVSAANCCCLWLIGGGTVTAYLMQQGQSKPLALGDGAIGGLSAGIVGAFVYAVVSVPVRAVTAPLQQGVAEMLDASADVPPEVLEMVEQLSSSTAWTIIVGFLVMLLAGMVFSTLGGLLGALIFRKETLPPAGTVEVLPPEPPAL